MDAVWGTVCRALALSCCPIPSPFIAFLTHHLYRPNHSVCVIPNTHVCIIESFFFLLFQVFRHPEPSISIYHSQPSICYSEHQRRISSHITRNNTNNLCWG